MEPVTEALRVSPLNCGFKIAWLEERVALYTDDPLLFLDDPGPSLEGALQMLEMFSSIAGLKVNWSKSLKFPIDTEARKYASPTLQLQWVEQFKYLGGTVSRLATDYLKLNLLPVYQTAKSQLKAWEN